MDFESDFIILIPPSEGKVSGGFEPSIKPTFELLYILDLIKKYDGDLTKLYGVKGKFLDNVININNGILSSKTMESISRYSGVVYKGINYSELNLVDKKFFNEHVLILSGLFGLLKPQYLIPNYKVKIDKLGLQKFWKDRLFIKDKFVVDLLPKVHKKAINYSKGIEIEFKIKKNGLLKPAGHRGKLIKGKFIRFLIESKGKNWDSFSLDGFKFNGKCFVKIVE